MFLVIYAAGLSTVYMICCHLHDDLEAINIRISRVKACENVGLCYRLSTYIATMYV